MGANWANSWQRRIDLTGINASPPSIVAYRGNDQPVTFTLSGGEWGVPGNRNLSMTKAGDGHFLLKDELRGTTEAYSGTTGFIDTETTRTGMIRNFGYDGERLVDIGQRTVDHTTQSAMALSLTYDSNGRITSVVPPSGQAIHYSYDANGNLSTVRQPDAYVRQYLYEDARFPHALTGVINESGSRIATWSYDASGRAVSVSHPDTTRNTSFTYGSGTTTVSDMYGSTTYVFNVGDTYRPGSITTPKGAISRTWDSAGNLKQKVSPDGDTQYTWDSANRPTKAIATVAGKKTVTTIEYSDSSSLRPHLVATPGRIRAFVYDSSGNVTGYADRQTTDLTGEQGMQATGTGSQLTVGARYDAAGRMLSATIVQDGKTVEDWAYTYDIRGNLDTTRDAVSGWQMQTLPRDSANRATGFSGNNSDASVRYDVRGRVSYFDYNEKAVSANGGVARHLQVQYTYNPDGSLAKRAATVSTNGGFPYAISDAEADVWLTNWELGNNPVSPPANLTGLKSATAAPISAVCVECYVAWKAKLTGRLFGDELSEVLPAWRETTELKLVDQAQIPYPTLVPDLTASAKRSMLYASVFKGGSDDGGLMKCSSREDHQDQCHAQYEIDSDICTTLAAPRGIRFLALCRQKAFDRYQACRGY